MRRNAAANARKAADRDGARIRSAGAIVSSNTQGQKKPRQFKSAEKPLSLHPLSFKEALVALLQVGPVELDRPSDRPATKADGPDELGQQGSDSPE